MRWLSIDPATKTGVAEWDGASLVCVSTMRPAGVREAKAAKVESARAVAIDTQLATARTKYTSVYASMRDALLRICVSPLVVVEESFGESPKTIAQLGERRGYIESICDERGHVFKTVNAEEWKRVCGQELDAAWPNATKAAKERSIELAAKHYNGLVVSDDEGDAIWLGRAALRLGVVKL